MRTLLPLAAALAVLAGSASAAGYEPIAAEHVKAAHLALSALPPTLQRPVAHFLNSTMRADPVRLHQELQKAGGAAALRGYTAPERVERFDTGVDALVHMPAQTAAYRLGQLAIVLTPVMAVGARAELRTLSDAARGSRDPLYPPHRREVRRRLVETARQLGFAVEVPGVEETDEAPSASARRVPIR